MNEQKRVCISGSMSEDIGDRTQEATELIVTVAYRLQYTIWQTCSDGCRRTW